MVIKKSGLGNYIIKKLKRSLFRKVKTHSIIALGIDFLMEKIWNSEKDFPLKKKSHMEWYDGVNDNFNFFWANCAWCLHVQYIKGVCLLVILRGQFGVSLMGVSDWEVSHSFLMKERSLKYPGLLELGRKFTPSSHCGPQEGEAVTHWQTFPPE